MLTIDFKLINYWSQPKHFFEQSIGEVSPKAVVNCWRQTEKRYYQGGYCIIIDGIPWNSFDVTSPNNFAIDHIDGANSFLCAVRNLKNSKPVVENSIWQIDGSSMSLKLSGSEVVLEDLGCEFEAISVDWHSFLMQFIIATKAFVDFQTKLLRVLQDEPNKTAKLEQIEANIKNDHLSNWVKILENIQL